MDLKNKSKEWHRAIKAEIQRVIDPQNIKEAGTPRQSLEQWLSKLQEIPESRGQVAITALRNHTWIEWGVYCACVVRRMGFEATILYKGSEIKERYKEPSYFNFWSGVKNIPDIWLVDLEELPYDENHYNDYLRSNDKMLKAALAYDHHIEAADIDDNFEKYRIELGKLKQEAAMDGARLRAFFAKKKFHQFICYSGIIRGTSLLLDAAIKERQETVCVEGWAWREGHMIYNFNAPALDYNVNGWMKYFGEWDENKDKEISEYFGFLEGKQTNSDWLNNFHNVQQAIIDTNFPEYIRKFLTQKGNTYLLACNVIGDSSLLNRETIFRSHKQFISETIKFFKKRNDLKLIIRIHPAEEWVKAKVNIRLGEFSKKEAYEQTNILIIDSDEKVNTFSLIPYIHCGLVWVTSAGADMVARGVPVIAAAKPKYYGLGIVNEPKTVEEYFKGIDYYSADRRFPTDKQIIIAKKYLYLVFKGFSFEAQGRTYRAMSCRLNDMPDQVEHDRFFRIILKEEKAPDVN